MNLQNNLRKCILFESIQSWKDAETSKKESWSEMAKTSIAQKLPRRRFEARWRKHALQHQWSIWKDDHWSYQSSQKHLYSSRILWLSWKDKQGRFWKAPRVSETCLSLSSICCWQLSARAWIAEGYLSARASSVQRGWFADSARAAEGNLWLIQSKETTEAFGGGANVPRDKELVQLWKMQIKQKPWKSVNTFKQDQPATVLECSAHLAEKLTDQPVSQVDVFSEETVLEA